MTTSAFPVEGLLPKQATQVDAFLQRFPAYNGRGVRVAVLDTGVDPAALGLSGPNKVVDVIDCTGAGDVPLTTVEAAPASDGQALVLRSPTTQRSLLVNPAWRNPTKVWKVGTKRAYDLWPAELVKRRKAERRRALDVSHAACVQQTLARGDEVSDECKARLALLKDMLDAYEDPGPVLEAVVFHDGEHWRAAVGGAEGDVADSAAGMPAATGVVDLREAPLLTDYRIERQWAVFGATDLLTYTVNILDDGAMLSLVTLAGTHGTHVAGIVGAATSEAATSGVAPGAEIVSLKIGDARLGSMEQGQALLRATQALIDTRCDVANMSYGEDGAFTVENKGAFAAALQRVIREHGVCFVSSAGNNGPALSTVGQPGGTTSGVLSVGAYVSAGAMQAAEYALVERDVPSNVTTWSSRGPTADGAAGVSVYAPGAAITSICRYALQATQLMNGTSMSSPHAAGCVALLVSALKARGLPVSPFRVFRAIEATGQDVGDALGVPLLDVEAAWEYLEQHAEDPYADAEFRVAVQSAGKTRPTGRGVYLRSAAETQRTSQHMVTVTPAFREGDKLAAYGLEVRAALVASAPWVHVPEFLVLGGNGRSFEVRVAADKLAPGLHSARVTAVDTARANTPLFEVPVTVAKPVAAAPTYAFPRVHLARGQMERAFVHVPRGATWADVRVRSTRHEAPGTSARFWLHLVALEPQRRLSAVEQAFVLALNEDEPVTKRVRVAPDTTLEVCAAQFWSNVAGFDLALDIEFHGLEAPARVCAATADGLARVNVSSVLRVEEFKPRAVLDTRRTSARPSRHTLRALRTPRDRQPSGRQLTELVLEYALPCTDVSNTFTCRLPISGNLYDASVTLLTQLVDAHNARLHFGDVYAKEVTVPRGDYTLRVQVLHEDAAVLERLVHMPLRIDERLTKPKEVVLDVYADHVDAFGGAAPVKDAYKLLPGERRVVCLDTRLEGERRPEGVQPSDVLLGTLTLGSHTTVPLELLVGPPPAAEPAPAEPADPTPLPELLAGVARKLKGDEQASFLRRLAAEHPGDLEVLTACLEKQVDPAATDARPNGTATDEAKARASAAASDAILATIDESAVLHYFGATQPPTAEQSDDDKRHAKKMRAHKKALALALVHKAQALATLGDREASDAALLHARKYVDAADKPVHAMYTNLLVRWHMHHERYVLRASLTQLRTRAADTPQAAH